MLCDQTSVVKILFLAFWIAIASPVNAQESAYIYGIHDHDTNPQEYLSHILAAGATGWVTATIAIGSNPTDTGGDDFRWIADQGHTVIVRLNHGYCPNGTIPTPDKYDDFAKRAANYVAATQGANIFVIGNETNLGIEWPSVRGHARYVSPQDYATVFRKTYDAIKAVRPDAKVLSQALAPFAGPFPAGNTCGYSHDGNPLNWVQYMNQMLTAIKNSGGIDGIALHINSRGYTYSDIHSTQKVSAGGQNLYFSFYVYKDWIDYGIPADLYDLPLYATEANGIYFWSGGHPERPDLHYEPGWMQEIYAEINRYNQQAAATSKPIFRAVNMYRWCAWCDGWNIDGSPYKGQILADLDQALAAGYRWPSNTPPPTQPAGENIARNAIDWSASSSFNSAADGSKAYDGVISEGSKWTSDGTTVESWLALDLGATYDITGFILRHAGAGGEPTYFNTQSYRLELGNSLAGPWTSLATASNAAQENNTTTTLATSVSGRYVRLYITDAGIDNYARIPEFEVYGTPAAGDEPDPGSAQNVARGAVDWAASSTFNANAGGDQAHDGVVSEGSKWTSDGLSAESWLALDLGATYAITRFVVRHAGDAGEAAYFNTQAFRLERGDSLGGPWVTLASVDNAAQAHSSTTTLASPVTTRYVRLYITDAGIDNYARIPEFEVYGTPVSGAINLIQNGDFSSGTNGWSVWTERGTFNVATGEGALHLQSSNHNGGLYQQFNTGGAGTAIAIHGNWASAPTAANTQWAEVLIINGARVPTNGEDVNAGQNDVVLIYKNDTWTAPAGWSGEMAQTAAVANLGSFTAAGDIATVVLKSGNVGGTVTGTRFDDIVVESTSAPGNRAPTAVATADPTTGQAPLSVSFDASLSTDPDGDVLAFSWDFGDGTQAAGASATHIYDDAGTYVARLTVDDGAGGSDEATLTISVTGAGVPMPAHCPAAANFPAIRAQLNQQGQDLAHVKIGFHVGPGGNQNGLGIWMECLDAGGVPFFLKSVDAAGSIWEAARLKAASGVPHVLVYRKSVDSDPGWNPDVPEYALAPYDAAVRHWQRHRDKFPPELEPYKHLIWVETINEVDKNRSEWLAEFAFHTAQLAIADGFNWAAFGWSSGEPEPVHWQGPNMRQFLELAASNPDRIAVALHEYSYVLDNLDRMYPYLVGRFQFLFDATDAFGLARPTVLVTEFGWVYDDVAPLNQAMQTDIPWAAALYANFPQVQGAAIWYLGPGFGGIANRAQQLIVPMTEYALQNYFVITR
jgi:PKD repeat protein